MNDIKKMLVAVDFSGISRDLVRYALQLAEKLQAKVYLINIINQRDIDAIRKVADTTDFISLPEQLEERREERRTSLLELVAELNATGKPISCQVRTGVPYEALVAAIKEMEIDLLVMGTRGRGQFSGMLFGSTAARMLSKCPVPLVTLRDSRKARAIT